MAKESLSFGERFLLFFLLPFQVLFDGARAYRVQQALPAASAEEPKALKAHLQDERKAAHKDADALKKVERAFSDAEEVLEKERKEHAANLAALEKKNTMLGQELVEAKKNAAKQNADLAELKEAQNVKETRDKDASGANDDIVAALQLLSIFQRDGRLVDFLMEDVKGFSDAEVGGAARQVHEGCSKSLKEYFSLEAVREEEEDAVIEVLTGFDAHLLRLTGNVSGTGPYRGHLAHAGWKVVKHSLPKLAHREHANIIAPAEVEL